MHTAYAKGFLQKCAEYGLSQKAAEALLSIPRGSRASRYFSDVKHNFSEMGKDAWRGVVRQGYRLGLVRPSYYIRNLGSYANALVGRVGPDRAKRILSHQVLGSGSDRGDTYEREASRWGILSTSLPGRVLGAYQPTPEEIHTKSEASPSAFSGTGVFGRRIPGAATALDLGGYMVPYLNTAMFAREAAHEATDGNYLTAAVFAGAAPISRVVSYPARAILAKTRPATSAVGKLIRGFAPQATGTAGVVGTTMAASLADEKLNSGD